MTCVPGIATMDLLGPSYGSPEHIGVGQFWPEAGKNGQNGQTLKDNFQSFPLCLWAIKGKIWLPLVSLVTWVPVVATRDLSGLSYGSPEHIWVGHFWPETGKIRQKWVKWSKTQSSFSVIFTLFLGHYG